jgi:quercetin dioxygenase-like cupin family protein
MSRQQWRISVYDLGAGQSCAVTASGHAFVYAAGGDATVAGATIAAGEGAFASGGEAITSAGGAWLYEIAPGAPPPRNEDGLSPVLSRLAVLGEGEHMLRADRVESQAGARTPAHRHRGPGIRRLESGLLIAEVGDDLDRIGAGGAWFETGHETVVGSNISGGVNVFIRVMLLPVELAGGQSSFIAATPADADKPRAVNLRLFGERPI